MTTTIVQYVTTPESADENLRRVQAVFAELAEQGPAGLRYAVFRLEDGVSFIHVAVSDEAAKPLTEFAAFRAFQHGARDRQVPGTRVANDATIVGSYGFLTP